jgi:hypothetical protein
MESTEKFSADPEELAARLRLSQERLRDLFLAGSKEAASKDTRTPRVWAACVALTAGWGKVSDTVHASGIEQQAGLAKGKASAILRDLDAKGVIVWQKDRGLRSPGTLSLPPLSTAREQAPAAREQAPATAPGALNTCPECGWHQSFATTAVCGGCGWEQGDERDMASADALPHATPADPGLVEVERLFGDGPTSDELDKERRRG